MHPLILLRNTITTGGDYDYLDATLQLRVAVIGSSFLIYCILDFFLLNNIVTWLTSQSTYFENLNKILNKLMNREFEILNYEEIIRMFKHEDLEIELSERYLAKYVTMKNRFQLVRAIHYIRV